MNWAFAGIQLGFVLLNVSFLWEDPSRWWNAMAAGVCSLGCLMSVIYAIRD